MVSIVRGLSHLNIVVQFDTTGRIKVAILQRSPDLVIRGALFVRLTGLNNRLLVDASFVLDINFPLR